MKPEEIIKAVEELSHEVFDPDTWMRWFNEALQDLAPVLKLETYEEFAIENTAERELPGDIFDIRLFKVDNTKLNPVGLDETDDKDGYWLWENNACFPESRTGTGKLWYHRRPAKFNMGSARPDIQEGYEDALIFYAAAKAKAPDRWLMDKSDFYQDYLMRKGQIELERNRQMRRPRHVKTGAFTAGGRFR